jgi:hypothetical protein
MGILMMRATRLHVVFLLIQAGCGDGVELPASDFDTNMSLTWPLAEALCMSPGNLDGIEAVAWFGGNSDAKDDCPLTVANGTHTATGTCKGVLPGILRPVVVYYYKTSKTRGVGMVVGWVDVTYEKLATVKAGENVVADLSKVTPTYLSSEVLAWDTENYDRTDPKATAQAFAGTRYRNSQLSFDSDTDGCPNLLELCNGTLDTPGTGC